MCEFTNAKEEYSKLRKEQAELIGSYLREKVDSGTVIVKDSEIFHQNPGDSNEEEFAEKLEFHWIKVPKGRGGFIVSLQAYDQDTGSKNYHWLPDRIGIYRYDEDPIGCININGTTAINLPMDDEKFERLTGIINSPDEDFDKALCAMSPFDKARKRYESARGAEIKLIVDRLNRKGYFNLNKEGKEINCSGRNGSSRYRGGRKGKIDPPYDLGNWKYIEAYKNEKYYFISLQSFYNRCFTDDDSKAQFPAAFDTIGVFCCKENLKINEDKNVYDVDKMIREKMKPTDITLPLSPGKIEKLLDILKKLPADG